MNALRLCLIALLLAAGPALAQQANPAEIAFWESVRDSKNPAELRAYLQQFPKGVFAPLAQARLAVLEGKPAAAPAVLPPSHAGSGGRMPQVGDTWTYRLSYPSVSRGRHIGLPTQQQESDFVGKDQASIHVVTVTAVQGDKIVDRVSVDGGVATETAHNSDSYIVTQGVSLFSPYLIAYRELLGLGRISILDAACNGQYGCRASGRYLGNEMVTVAGRSFTALKVRIEENWWPARPSGHYNQVSQMNGGRTLTVWYSRELKRVVKVTSRLTVGDVPPVDSHWDLELVSYQVK